MIPAQQDGANAPLPAPETRLNGADPDRLRRSLDSSVSDNTRAMYNSAWRGFEAWAQAPRRPVSPGFPAPRRCLPRPLGRGTTSLGGHRETPQGSPGRDPQGQWPRGLHRIRGCRFHKAGFARKRGCRFRKAGLFQFPGCRFRKAALINRWNQPVIFQALGFLPHVGLREPLQKHQQSVLPCLKPPNATATPTTA